MFRPVPMSRLNVVVLQRDERAVLREVGRLGVVQLTRTPSGEDTAPLASLSCAPDLARCDQVRSRITELRRVLAIGSGPGTGAPFATTFPQAETELSELEGRARELVTCREALLRRREELEAVGLQAALLSGLNTPLEEFGRFEFLHFVTGMLPEGALARLEVEDQVALWPEPGCSGRQRLIAVTAKSHRNALDQALKRVGFEVEPLPLGEGVTVEEWMVRARREQEEIQGRLGRVCEGLETLATRSARVLDGLEAWVGIERQFFEVGERLLRTESAVFISGWIPDTAVPEVRRGLHASTGGRCVVEVSPPGAVPEEEIPVLLRLPWFLRPFALLVAAYGLPRYGEVAPTLFVAISFVVMFGMMFGDVGHGGVLALAGLVALLRSRTQRWRDVGVLLICNGLASVGFGLVYGSYFGMPHLKRHALWRDPLEGNPLALMGLAIGMGIVLMSLGLALNILNRLRRRDWICGLFGKFGMMGVLFYWGALVVVARSAEIQAAGWWTEALLLLVVLPVTCWVCEGPLKLWADRRTGQVSLGAGMLGIVTESLVGAFEGLLLYLANTVSFVRLAAYAMSHAALLVATFTLAEEVGRHPMGGAVFGLLVVVLGNAAAVLLEGVVATVQALRLEYYEFFGKFFSGEGKPFKPFGLAASPA